MKDAYLGTIALLGFAGLVVACGDSAADGPDWAPSPSQLADGEGAKPPPAVTHDAGPARPPSDAGSWADVGLPPAADSGATPAADAGPPADAPSFAVNVGFGTRFGDNDALSHVGTSLHDLPSLFIINTDTNAVAVKLQGSDLDNARGEVASSDHMTITFPGWATPGVYALVDGRYAAPVGAISQPSGGSVEQFPPGVVGYFELVESGGVWSGRSGTDVLWSGWDLSQLAGGNVDRLKSPLVLDLAGRGLSFDPPRCVFDIDADGTRDRLAWISSSDTPFLVRDRNANGVVDGADELFGDGTLDANGTGRTSRNGFEALAQHDATRDGVIDARDPVFTELALWFDRNHDGVTDPGELETLRAHGIKQLSLDYVGMDGRGDFGNRVLQRSAATTTTGSVPIYDVWFRF